MRLEHLEVCADPVAGAEDNQVAAHEFDRINGAEGSVTPHPGECRKQGGETLGRPVGAVVLREREDRVEHDHHDDGNGERGHTGDDRQPARDPQQHGEQAGELAREGANRRTSGQRGEGIGTVDRETLLGLAGRQPLHASKSGRGLAPRGVTTGPIPWRACDLP